LRFCAFVLPAVVLAGSLALTGCAATDPSLNDAVRKLLDASTFDVNMLDKEASVLVAHGSDRRFYTREEIAEVLDTARRAGTKYDVSNFKILHEDRSGQFASIDYQVTWRTSVNSATITTDLLSHEIWERSGDGWVRVFAAMDAKQK
jgi:hypothetical protein